MIDSPLPAGVLPQLLVYQYQSVAPLSVPVAVSVVFSPVQMVDFVADTEGVVAEVQRATVVQVANSEVLF